ncbi:MAG: hypothetical protein QM809_14930 [Gordonia sp. (in: high G+C Gram-positive bacteria)]|uniref:hypothetical protein n=1 Tax=Gordonia sp. (in: high G+C Gram-positive bacteria) TaxID=84139 RepID=UPI0039E516DE
MRIVWSAAAALCVAVLATGCTTTGGPRSVPDLSAKALPAAEFGTGAMVVASGQIPNIVSDITLRPVRGDVVPARCTPAGVDDDTAVVVFAPGPTETSTLTELVARTDESLDDLARAATGCATFRGGATGQLEVASTVVDPPGESGGVARMRLRRSLRSPGIETVTTLDQWIAQRDDLRVLVQLRATGPVPDTAHETAAALFETAVRRAFR